MAPGRAQRKLSHARMPDTLTALDATFLELEQLDPGALMSIGEELLAATGAQS